MLRLPSRAARRQKSGQPCLVELADYLHTWRPGRIAHLHLLPFALDAEPATCGLPLTKMGGGACALHIGFHVDPCARGKPLAEIDRFSMRCSELLLRPDGDTVFTNTDRLDGEVGSADLLVIYDDGAATGA